MLLFASQRITKDRMSMAAPWLNCLLMAQTCSSNWWQHAKRKSIGVMPANAQDFDFLYDQKKGGGQGFGDGGIIAILKGAPDKTIWGIEAPKHWSIWVMCMQSIPAMVCSRGESLTHRGQLNLIPEKLMLSLRCVTYTHAYQKSTVANNPC